MANLICVRLNKGDSPSWGFRLQGGKDFGTPLVVQKIIGGSPAERAGLIAGDTVIKINNTDVYNLRHKDAQDVILRAGNSFDVAIQRGGSTWKPAVTPVGSISNPRPVSSVNNISPVTNTSLAAGRQDSIGAIGTSHNVSAKPFHQINGGPKLVNKQYNSPLPIYSEQSIAETLSAQTEVLANGVLGVNFKKNEKSYNAANSEVFRMVQEADKEPRDYESEPDTSSSGVITAPLGVAGLRHVSAPENKPAPPTPQLPPGQNICADCERLIVGVFVRIKDKNLHVECFKCATCGTSLKNIGYYNLNNKLYCDVHAKLAARNNPPAPNLQPVTVPPGGKIPSGTISAALSSHSLPSPSSLSPNTNYSAAPYLSGSNYSTPKPFCSVTAPLSPTSHTPKLSPTSTPFTETRSIQNIVWPPAPNEPELPTASPLYFPPPSQVQEQQKLLLDISESSKLIQNNTETEYKEEDMSFINKFTEDRNMSLCSTEVFNITERLSATQCLETISDTVDTQILVDSILQSRPKSPPPVVIPESKQQSSSGDVHVSFTITEAQLKEGACGKIKSSSEITESNEIKTCLRETQQQSLASIYEKKIKVENTVPHKWESPMVTALTVASDKPYVNLTEEKSLQKDNFSEIPTKTSNTPLAAALAVAPAVPFTPSSTTLLKPVPLPEETVPYFPPEHHIILSPKPSDEEKPAKPAKTKVYGKQKPEEKDALFQDLPTPPTEKISMLAALTTAPDRPYSPFNSEFMESNTTMTEQECSKIETQESKREVATKSLENYSFVAHSSKPILKTYAPFPSAFSEKTEVSETSKSLSNIKDKAQTKEVSIKSVDNRVSDKLEVSKHVHSTEDVTNVCAGLPPMIQVVRSTFETGTDKVQMEMCCQFLGDPVPPTQVIKKHTTDKETKVIEQNKNETYSNTSEKISSQTANKKTLQEQQKAESHEVAFLPTKELPSTISSDSLSNVTESMLLNKTVSSFESDRCDTTKLEHTQTVKTSQQKPNKEPLIVLHPGETNLNVPKISFQPVDENDRSSTTFSPRPRSLTPSMINKPAPVLPYYQANLVATQYTAAETSIFDPTSPAISRSPTPSIIRPSSPFITPSSSVRPISPAQGPPPNPLQSHKSLYEIKQEGKIKDARSHLETFIPQHQNRAQQNTLLTYQGETPTVIHNISESGKKNVTTKHNTKQEVLCEATKQAIKSSQCIREGNVQIQRKTHVAEEYEHQQKSKFIQSEKGSNTSKVIERQKVATAATESQAVAGFHITNPQPLRSTFFNTDATSVGTTSAETHSKIPKRVEKSDANLKTSPNATAIASAIPAVNTIPNKNITKPNVSQPNVGTGGGRQAGAIGVAPKRGRGILNLAATPGSRVPLCAQCNTNIRGPFITALGKIWCPDHFICATPSCRRPLHDLGFVEEHGQLYCEYCFEQYLAPPCSKCNAKIKGDCLKAIGKNFHPECFNCVYCGKLFGNSPFFLEDAQPYCETDWNELFTTKCFACGFPVEAGDRWVEALNNNYHSQCFNCTMCKKNLEGQSFFAKGGRPFCKNHAR